MPEKPLRFVKIDDLAKHVQSTLSRAVEPLPQSLIRQLGGLISHCLRVHMRGDDACPGIKKMAGFGKCSERQARRNLRQIEAWLVMCPTQYIKGGRRTTRYWLDLMALKRALVCLGCNPSPALLEKIADAYRDINPDMRADIKPGHEGGHMTGHDVRRYTYSMGSSGKGGEDA